MENNVDLHTDFDLMSRNIVKHGIDYLERYPSIKTLIIGLSGGIDSTLVAALAREICDETKEHKLIGYSIPIESNKEDEIKGAKLAGQAFCHEFKEIDWIEESFFLDLFSNKTLGVPGNVKEKSFKDKIRAGNFKARLRMMFLYDKAQEHDGLVLSTDNLTEYNLGFWTLHGDVGDLGLIQSIWKTELYGISCYLWDKYHDIFKEDSKPWDDYKLRRDAVYQASKAVPTDGLGITDSDFDQLGVRSYREVDEILIEYLNDNRVDKEHPVIKRHLDYAFKRKNPYNISREDIMGIGGSKI